MEPRITQSVKEVGDILLSIKGGGQISSMNQPPPRATVSAEADEVLRPLMDLLDGKFLGLGLSCYVLPYTLMPYKFYSF